MSQPDPITCAVVLAGGLGTRLGNLTASLPKPLVDVAGRPFLLRQIDLLGRHGVSSLVVLTGHLGDQIRSCLGDGSRLGMSIAYSHEQAPLGTGGALRLAAGLLPDEFFLVNGDTYLDCDYRGAASKFQSRSAGGPRALMVVAPAHAVEDPGNVRLSADGDTVVSYAKGAGGDHDYIDAGVLVLNKEAVACLPEIGPSALERDLFPLLASKGRMLAFVTEAKVYDIGTPERLSAFERSLS